jgi:hypothetical protein
MLELQLEPEIEALLEEQATKAGETKAEFIRRAILERLEDREDYEMAVSALKESPVSVSFEEVVKSLGMEAEFPPKGAEATRGSGQSDTEANSRVPVRKTARIA